MSTEKRGMESDERRGPLEVGNSRSFMKFISVSVTSAKEDCVCVVCFTSFAL